MFAQKCAAPVGLGGDAIILTSMQQPQAPGRDLESGAHEIAWRTKCVYMQIGALP